MHRDWVTEIGGATFAGAARSIRSYPLEDLEAAELNEHCFAVMHWPTNRRRLPPFAASQSATNVAAKMASCLSASIKFNGGWAEAAFRGDRRRQHLRLGQGAVL